MTLQSIPLPSPSPRAVTGVLTIIIIKALCAERSSLQGSLPFPWNSETIGLDKRKGTNREPTHPAPGSAEEPQGARLLIEDLGALGAKGAAQRLLASEMGNPSVGLSLTYQYLAP